jgi:hypothetical protein
MLRILRSNKGPYTVVRSVLELARSNSRSRQYVLLACRDIWEAQMSFSPFTAKAEECRGILKTYELFIYGHKLYQLTEHKRAKIGNNLSFGREAHSLINLPTTISTFFFRTIRTQNPQYVYRPAFRAFHLTLPPNNVGAATVRAATAGTTYETCCRPSEPNFNGQL